jgi:hypothetical protein
VENACVGTELCLVEVSGEACMCRSKLGDIDATGAGKRESMGCNPERLPCMEVL